MDEQQFFVFNNIRQRIIRDLVGAQDGFKKVSNYSEMVYLLAAIISDLEDSYTDIQERRS
jgi:hypothetical protein